MILQSVVVFLDWTNGSLEQQLTPRYKIPPQTTQGNQKKNTKKPKKCSCLRSILNSVYSTMRKEFLSISITGWITRRTQGFHCPHQSINMRSVVGLAQAVWRLRDPSHDGVWCVKLNCFSVWTDDHKEGTEIVVLFHTPDECEDSGSSSSRNACRIEDMNTVCRVLHVHRLAAPVARRHLHEMRACHMTQAAAQKNTRPSSG